MEWIIIKYDWLIYRLAYKSMRRMCNRDPAFALILSLWINEWISKNPISERVEKSAVLFYEAMRDNENGDKMIDKDGYE